MTNQPMAVLVSRELEVRDLLDTAGRTPLRVALASWLDRRGVKAASFEQVYQRLATRPIKVKVGRRMTKLDPSSMEWFLLNLFLVEYRRMASGLSHRGLPAFKSPPLAALLSTFPPAALASHRRRREYVSSILAKNEVFGSSAYNRRLFLRVAHGYYVLNPALEIDVKGDWIEVAALMQLPLLFEAMGPALEYLRSWTTRTRAQMVREIDAEATSRTGEASGIREVAGSSA